MDSRIQRISVEEFEQCGAVRHPLGHELMEELEHYAVLDGWYLGASLVTEPTTTTPTS
jgi:hypothetical protein